MSLEEEQVTENPTTATDEVIQSGQEEQVSNESELVESPATIDNETDVEKASEEQPVASESNKPSSLDWPLSEEQTQIGIVGLLALVVIMAVVLIFKPSAASSGELPSQKTPEPDNLLQDTADNNLLPGVKEEPVKPPPMVVDFTPGQSSMVKGAPSLPSGSITEKIGTFAKKYGMFIMPLIYVAGGPIMAFLGNFGLMNVAMLGVAAIALYVVYSSWPTGPEGDQTSDYAKFVFKQIAMVLVVLVAVGLGVLGVYQAVPAQVWTKSSEFLATYLPFLSNMFTTIYRAGLSFLPF